MDFFANFCILEEISENTLKKTSAGGIIINKEIMGRAK